MAVPRLFVCQWSFQNGRRGSAETCNGRHLLRLSPPSRHLTHCLLPTPFPPLISKPSFPVSLSQRPILPAFHTSLRSKTFLLLRESLEDPRPPAQEWLTKQCFHSDANLSLDKIQGKVLSPPAASPVHPSPSCLLCSCK